MSEEDLKTLVREFRASVSSDLAEEHRRMDVFAEEMRQRIATAETAIMNEIRAMANRFDLRLGRIENRLDELGT